MVDEGKIRKIASSNSTTLFVSLVWMLRLDLAILPYLTLIYLIFLPLILSSLSYPYLPYFFRTLILIFLIFIFLSIFIFLVLSLYSNFPLSSSYRYLPYLNYHYLLISSLTSLSLSFYYLHILCLLLKRL